MCSPRARVNNELDSKTAFQDMKIDSYECLEQVEGRTKCPGCKLLINYTSLNVLYVYLLFQVVDPGSIFVILVLK